MKLHALLLLVLFGCTTNRNPPFAKAKNSQPSPIQHIKKSDAAWKEELNPEAYQVLRKSATEQPFTGKWLLNKKAGQYVCGGCGLPLFNSDTKYETSCGWPSFFDSLDKSHIIEVEDSTLGMKRTELRCARCDGHLGHVFKDGPPPTGLRYCINSASLDFISTHQTNN